VNVTGFAGYMCFAFFHGPSGNKAVVMANPLIGKKAVVFTKLIRIN